MVDCIEYFNYLMYVGKGFKMVVEKFFNEFRNGVFCVFIVIIDGRFRDGFIKFLEEFKRFGVIIILVGIGKCYDKV